MSKTKIKISETDENILLYGITTLLDDYKLSWLLNTELNINLIKTDNYFVSKKGLTDELYFSAYQVISDENNISLISNKTDNSIKLINISNIDYLLKINNSNYNIEELINKIKSLQGIIAVTNIKDNPNIQKKILKEITNFLK